MNESGPLNLNHLQENVVPDPAKFILMTVWGQVTIATFNWQSQRTAVARTCATC